MPRGDRSNWGGARQSHRPDTKKAGRPKAFATVRIPIDDARAVVGWLLANKPDPEHPAERGIAFLIAGLWQEVSQSPDQE